MHTPHESPPSVPLPRRLQRALPRWEKILPPSSPELKWLKEGFSPEFLDPANPPRRLSAPPRPLALRQKAVVATFIKKFLELGILEPVRDRKLVQFVSNVILIQKEGKEDRPVADLADLNDNLVPAPSFKLPSVLDLANIFPPTHPARAVRRRLAKVDISKMFYHVPVSPSFRPWLAIEFEGRLYWFAALPMGLQQSPFVTKKLLAATTSTLSFRQCLIVYVDDMLVTGRSHKQTASRLRRLLDQLQLFGWTVNEEKTSTEPAGELTFLGWSIDATTPTPTASLLAKRRQTIKKAVRQLRNRSAPPGRFSQTLGLLVSVLLVDPLLAAALRPLHHDLAQAVAATSWRSKTLVVLSPDSAQSLEFISKSMAAELWSSRTLDHPPPPEIMLTTDASTEFGWGAVISRPPAPPRPPAETTCEKEDKEEPVRADCIAQDRWPTDPPPDNPWLLPSLEKMIDVAVAARRSNNLPPIPSLVIARARALHRLPTPHYRPPRRNLVAANSPWHITYLESLCSLYGLLVHAPHLAGKAIAVRTDATTTVAAWIRRSSSSRPINAVAWRLQLMLELLGCRLASATHIAGVLNNAPDEASRRWLGGREKLEWPLTRSALLRAYSTLTGSPPHPLTVDAFASSGNAKFPAFWSFKPDPRAEATDAFGQFWASRRLFINPPFELMDLVVDRLQRQRPLSAMILTPEWPGRPWHKTLTKLCQSSMLVHPKDVVEAGPTTNLAEPLRNAKWKLRFWWLAPPPQAAAGSL